MALITISGYSFSLSFSPPLFLSLFLSSFFHFLSFWFVCFFFSRHSYPMDPWLSGTCSGDQARTFILYFTVVTWILELSY